MFNFFKEHLFTIILIGPIIYTLISLQIYKGQSCSHKLDAYDKEELKTLLVTNLGLSYGIVISYTLISLIFQKKWIFNEDFNSNKLIIYFLWIFFLYIIVGILFSFFTDEAVALTFGIIMLITTIIIAIFFIFSKIDKIKYDNMEYEKSNTEYYSLSPISEDNLYIITKEVLEKDKNDKDITYKYIYYEYKVNNQAIIDEIKYEKKDNDTEEVKLNIIEENNCLEPSILIENYSKSSIFYKNDYKYIEIHIPKNSMN